MIVSEPEKSVQIGSACERADQVSTEVGCTIALLISSRRIFTIGLATFRYFRAASAGHPFATFAIARASASRLQNVARRSHLLTRVSALLVAPI